MSIRPMKSSDLPYVGALLGECFKPELRPYLTYAQHGILTFLEKQLAHAESLPDERYYVATDADDQAIGFAEFRPCVAKIGFLSYICIADHARGLGVATSLIDNYALSHESLESLELDVFHDNLAALRLYEKLGFAHKSQNVWLRRPIPPPSTTLSMFNSTVSAVNHATNGFCELEVEWQGQDVRLGRIGRNVLRCFDLPSFKNEDLLASAKATFASLSEVLTILPVCEVASLPHETFIVALSNRLTKTFDRKTSASTHRRQVRIRPKLRVTGLA